jgi:hypothetical protein
VNANNEDYDSSDTDEGNNEDRDDGEDDNNDNGDDAQPKARPVAINIQNEALLLQHPMKRCCQTLQMKTAQSQEWVWPA